MNLQLPIKAEQLIPHRLPMRLIDRLLECNEQQGVAEAIVDADCPLVDRQGRLEEVAFVEMIAQSYAAFRGFQDRLNGEPVRKGFLVAIKKLSVLESARAEDCLRIETETIAKVDGFAMAEGRVWRKGTLLARGEIQVWVN